MKSDVYIRPRPKAVETMRRALPAAVIATFGSVTAFPDQAAAQTAFTLPAPPVELPFLPSASGNWTLMIGTRVEYKPAFDGAKDSTFSPLPIFSIRRAGTAEPFFSPNDGASIALIDLGNFRAGPAGKFVSARKESKYSELRGLGDVKAAYEIGGFVEYFPVDWLRLRNETRQGFGGHEGIVSDFSADVIVPVTQAITIAAGPRFTWKSAKAISPYLGISATQALASGLPEYDAKSGPYSAGVGAQVKYRINRQWEVHTYVEYERLLGDAAKSPLVTARGSVNQTTFGIGASYAFDFKIR